MRNKKKKHKRRKHKKNTFIDNFNLISFKKETPVKTEKLKDTDKIKYVNRCQKNAVNTSSGNIYSQVLLSQLGCSGMVFNKTNFCQRTWYSRCRPIIINYMIKNIDKFLKLFSTRDKIALLKELIFRKDIKSINKILKYIRDWEEDELNNVIQMAKDKLDNSHELTEPHIWRNIVPKKVYGCSFKYTLGIIDEIGVHNFNDKHGDFSDYIITLREAFIKKIETSEQTEHKNAILVRHHTDPVMHNYINELNKDIHQYKEDIRNFRKLTYQLGKEPPKFLFNINKLNIADYPIHKDIRFNKNGSESKSKNTRHSYDPIMHNMINKHNKLCLEYIEHVKEHKKVSPNKKIKYRKLNPDNYPVYDDIELTDDGKEKNKKAEITDYHLIPNFYLINTGVDENYVKLQFEKEKNSYKKVHKFDLSGVFDENRK